MYPNETLTTLGSVYNSCVTNRHTQDDLRKKITMLVQNIDKSLLTGIMKVQMYQNLLFAMMATNDLQNTSIMGGISQETS